MRNAIHLALLAALIATGCAEKNEEVAIEPARADSVEYQALSGDYYAPENAEMPNDDVASAPSAAPATVAAPPPAGTTHTVAKGDTLHSLARMYYNNQARWKDIYDANRDTMKNPNQLRIGQELNIP